MYRPRQEFTLNCNSRHAKSTAASTWLTHTSTFMIDLLGSNSHSGYSTKLSTTQKKMKKIAQPRDGTGATGIGKYPRLGPG